MSYCAGCGEEFDDEDLCERCNRCVTGEDCCCWHENEDEED